MTYAFCVFYRFRLLSPEESEKAREFWKVFSKEDWPQELKIIGDYSFAWGTEWNGFLLIESENAEMFFQFWPRFREKTRWYIENTRTVIGKKRSTDELPI